MDKTKATTQSQSRVGGARAAKEPPGPSAPPETAADRSPASGTVDDLQTVTKAAQGHIPKARRSEKAAKRMAGEAQAETEAHVAISENQLRRSTEAIAEVTHEAAKTVEAVARSRSKMPDAKQGAKFERLARDLECSEDDEAFKGVLRKLARSKS